MKNFNETDGAAMAIGRMVSGQSRKAASAALLTLTLTMGISGCSHSKQQTSDSSQNSTQSQTAQVTTPAVPVSPATNPPAVAKKKSVKGPVRKLPATKVFNDEVSGLSFTYPRRSILEVGDKAEEDGVVADQLPMEFVQSGGITTAVVTLPGIAKSGSDYTPAIFAISVNKDVTAEQCGQFLGQRADKVNTDSVGDAVPSNDAQKLTIGNAEYLELDRSIGFGAAKYYHRFVPGSVPEDNACYEFAMSVKSAEPKQEDDKSSSDQKTATQTVPSLSDQHKAAFANLEKILASVNFKGETKKETVASSVQTADNKQ